MSAEAEILYCLLAHILMVVATGIWLARWHSIGLPVVYLINLLVLHGGAFVYLSPSYVPTEYIRSYRLGEYTVAQGYLVTAAGSLAFCLGVFVADLFRASSVKPSNEVRVSLMRCSWTLIIVGASLFVISRISIVPPGLQAMFLVGRNAIAVGLCMAVLYYFRASNLRGVLLYCALFMLLPLTYALILGFLSYGTQFVIVLSSMILMQLKPTFRNVISVLFLAAISSYAFISVFVIYMENRIELRQILWSNADIGERISAFGVVFSKIGPFDYENNVHMAYIDARLNQNILVGLAVDNLERYPERFANGRTLVFALFSWVPRFVWRDKPTTGSTAILTEFTGKRFDESTAMQSGNIFEFYVNFGAIGVLVGMAIYGFLLRLVDRCAIHAFRSNRFYLLAKYFMVGIVLVWPGDMLTSQLTAITATLILLFILKRFLISTDSSVNNELSSSSTVEHALES